MKKFLNKTLVLATVLSASSSALATNIDSQSRLDSVNKIDSFIELVNGRVNEVPFVLAPKSTNSQNLLFAVHGSHQSHQSHASHASHQSHYSGY